MVEKETGRKVLNFGIGSPDYPPSAKYVAKVQEFFAKPKAHLYPGYGPNPDFVAAIQKMYSERFGVTLETNEVFTLNGSKDGVSHIALTLLDAGDEALVPDPGYAGYAGPVLMVDAIPVYYNLTKATDFKIDYAELEQKMSEKTKFIWVNFPSNPTGQIATKAELVPLIEFCKKHQIWLLYDNAYAEIAFDGFIAPSILEIPGAKEVAVEFGSFSKSHSFAGYRIGWIAGNAEVVAALGKIKSQLDTGMAVPLQDLAVYALNNPDPEWSKAMIAEYQRRRDIIAEKLIKLGCKFEKPKASLYIWAEIPEEFADSEEFSMKILNEKQVMLTPGTAFGENGKRYVRVSICVNVDRIDEYL